MEYISVFDMFKIGIGPSSSHTFGPWNASLKFIEKYFDLFQKNPLKSIHIELFGSLSLTGKGHATHIAVVLGLLGFIPETIDLNEIQTALESIENTHTLLLNNSIKLKFNLEDNIIFKNEFLPFHQNAVRYHAIFNDNQSVCETYYSIGGGFIVQENNLKTAQPINPFPYPIQNGNELLNYCKTLNKNIKDIVLANELSLRNPEAIDIGLNKIFATMASSIYTGCHTPGILPGGLNVKRRAFQLHKDLIGNFTYSSQSEWLDVLKNLKPDFKNTLQWITCFALAVNEVNASMGRIVTAPTNGSAGVIPSVLFYYICFENPQATPNDIQTFLLIAGELGSIFKKGSTISAAAGGCQAEIGVSSAMAAAALCNMMGGSTAQVLIAAEIALEHHLGLTCDPVAGLVQIPCIERNAVGATKAIQAANLAIKTNPDDAKVPLDKVIKTMWDTAQDMNFKYKETSKGGLALNVNMADC
ncbi:MAG: L-serine ammonia-lyase [Alphaproteobacteria bacterium]|nr:L-serine ammonia-lyase [Alphaproteobacteria bacterium]